MRGDLMFSRQVPLLHRYIERFALTPVPTFAELVSDEMAMAHARKRFDGPLRLIGTPEAKEAHLRLVGKAERSLLAEYEQLTCKLTRHNGRPNKVDSDLMVTGQVTWAMFLAGTINPLNARLKEAARSLGLGTVSDGAAKHAYLRTEARCRDLAKRNPGTDPHAFFWSVASAAMFALCCVQAEERGHIPFRDPETEALIGLVRKVADLLKIRLSLNRWAMAETKVAVRGAVAHGS